MSFNQNSGTAVPTLINSSQVLLTGNAASANALTVRQFGTGNVFSASNASGTTALFVSAAGNVGIGMANPVYAMDITGDLNFTGTFRQNGTPYIGSQWTGTSSIYFLGNVGIGTASPATALDVYTGTMNAATVVATTHYGVLAGSNTVAASTVTATSLVGTMYGALAGSNTVAASTVTATSLVGTMYGALAGSNTVAASTVTGSADASFNSVKVGMGTGSVATNTAVGASALNANTTGYDNTAMGKEAMLSNTTGASNTAVGKSAMAANTTGASNTALGQAAMQNNTTGYNNTAVGHRAMVNNTTGAANTAVGHAAMQNNTGGYHNTAVGYDVMKNNTESNNNTAVGHRAMVDNTTGYGNTAVGFQVMYQNTTGYGNTAVGLQAMYQNMTGYNNTAVGYGAGPVTAGLTNTTCIGASASVSASNEVQCGDSATSFYAYGAYNNRSDIRDKADVRETVVGLDFINKVQAVDFRWNYREDYFDSVEEDVTDPETQTVMKARKLVPIPNDGSKKRTRFHQGVIAQQVKEVMDELGVDFAGYQDHTVKGGCDVLTIGYTEFVGPLIKAVQELSAQVTDLKTEVALLKSQGPTVPPSQ